MEKEEKKERKKVEHPHWEQMFVREPEAEYRLSEPGEYTLEDYLALPEERRVELIDGVFYEMAAPSRVHQTLVLKIGIRLSEYIEQKGGLCEVLVAPFDVQLDCDDKTVVQPDVMIICERMKGDEPRFCGAPDFVVEILSKSTRKKDMTLKLRKYKNAGVREYWIVDPEKRTVIVYALEQESSSVIYGFDAKVPVGIFGGECRVDFADISAYIRRVGGN